MKLFAIVSTLDLKYRLGCTPAWWQLLKALHENENEVVVIPYLGDGFETLWWRTYPNAWRLPGVAYYHLSKRIPPKSLDSKSRARNWVVAIATNAVTLPVWRRHILKVLEKERDVDAVLFFNIPLNQIKGIPSEIKRRFNVRTVFYDGDMPTIMPEHASKRGFMFDYYQGADLGEYDLFVVNSEGILESLKKMGARKVMPLHYAADPELFRPVNADKKWDVAFFGYGSQNREKWMTRMITRPSLESNLGFTVGGGGFSISLGKASPIGDVPMSEFRRFCCSAKVNLNITRESHTTTYGSSTARPFELAAMGCCVVSCPYLGLDKWFKPDREMIVLSENDDIVEIYRSLVSDDKRRNEIGEAARQRVLNDHTYGARASELVKAIGSINWEAS